MRVTWPLFVCLTPETQKSLRKYQEKNFPDTRLSPPPANSPGKWKGESSKGFTKIESLAKIARLMKETPRHVRRIVK